MEVSTAIDGPWLVVCTAPLLGAVGPRFVVFARSSQLLQSVALRFSQSPVASST